MSELRNASGADGFSPLVAGGIVFGLLGLSALVGRRNAPDALHPGIMNWYRRLDKPDFTPPDASFGAVWPVLEISMAVGGYRLLRTEPSTRRNASIGLWLVTTGMIGGWTEIFFRECNLAGSAAASSAMLASTAAYVATTHRVDRVAQATAVPLLGWLAFATVLATRIWQRNPSAGSR
jgi:tryptophan-rich sensory protein